MTANITVTAHHKKERRVWYNSRVEEIKVGSDYETQGKDKSVLGSVALKDWPAEASH